MHEYPSMQYTNDKQQAASKIVCREKHFPRHERVALRRSVATFPEFQGGSFRNFRSVAFDELQRNWLA